MSLLSWLIRRWWFWALMPLALVLLTALSIRWAGQAAWQREQAAARAAGAPTAFAELLATLPEVDVARQERLWQWCNQTQGQEWTQAYFSVYGHSLSDVWRDATTERNRRQQDRDTTRDERAAAAAEISAIIASGPIVWGSPGWLRQDVPAPERATLREVELARGLAYLALPGVVDLCVEQILARHDRAGLQHLDELFAATRAVATLNDAEAHLVIGRQRDAVYLVALALGLLDTRRQHAWLHETADATTVMAQGLLAERVCWLVLLVDERTAWSRLLTSTRPAVVATMLGDAVFLPLQAVRWSRRCRALAAALQGGPIPPDWDAWSKPPWTEFTRLRGLRLDRLQTYASRAMREQNRHRLMRAAARAILAWRAGALPESAAQAQPIMGAELHADAQIFPPLIYQWLSPTSFRIGIDPFGPLPAFATREQVSRVAPASGTARESSVIEGQWSLQLDCEELPPLPPLPTDATPAGDGVRAASGTAPH